MDNIAIKLVSDYIIKHLNTLNEPLEFKVYIVWKYEILQNFKYILTSTLLDSMYYELTYNKDKNRWHLNAYENFKNRYITVGNLFD